MDGAKQLTNGKQDGAPLCSSESSSFYYGDFASFQIMKMPIDGGTPQLVKASAIPNGYMTGAVSFSPDGKWMPEFLYVSVADTQTTTSKIALLDVAANAEKPVKLFDPRLGFAPPIAFTPDGKAVAYNIVENGVATYGPSPWMVHRACD